MAEYTGLAGGFVGANTANALISQCYSYVKIKRNRLVSGGFAGLNEGRMDSVLSQCTTKYQTGGLVGTKTENALSGNGNMFTHALKVYSKAFMNMWDNEKGVYYYDVNVKSAEKFGFGDKKVWEYAENDEIIKFENEKWFINIPVKANMVEISNADELMEFASKVNAGDKSSIKAHVVLTRDINMKGKKWMPIAADRVNAFAGIFDGRGFTIRNLSLKGSDGRKHGLIGHLKGYLVNVLVEAKIRGEGVIGGLVAVNEGNIAFSGVLADFDIKGKGSCLGGLVGINSGKVIRCYSAGQVSMPLVPMFLVAPVAAAVYLATVAAVTYAVTLPNKQEAQTLYAPIKEERNQVRITPTPAVEGENNDDAVNNDEQVVVTGETENSVEAGAANVIDFALGMNVTINLARGTCNIDFTNPEDANYKLVYELYLSNGESGEILIAKSDAVSPGYRLDYIELDSNMTGLFNPGVYSGLVKLRAYDVKNNNLSQINTSLPVTIKMLGK